MTGKRPWLAPALALRARLDTVLGVIDKAGWRVRRRRGTIATGISVTDPVRRIVWVSPNVLVEDEHGRPRPSPVLVALLVHELAHVRQFGRNRVIAAVRLAGYLRDRRTRLAMEIDAEGEETAVRYVIQHKLVVSAATLGGGQFPYYTGADQEGVVRTILERARQILLEEGIA